MTREEAIVILKDEAEYKKDYPYDRQAFEMAIKALSQEPNEWIAMLTEENERLYDKLNKEPCEDAISRGNVIADIYDKFMTVDGAVHNETARECIKIIQNEPPVTSSRQVIEDIKAEIEATRYGLINDGLDVALRIIDKHTEGR